MKKILICTYNGDKVALVQDDIPRAKTIAEKFNSVLPSKEDLDEFLRQTFHVVLDKVEIDSPLTCYVIKRKSLLIKGEKYILSAMASWVVSNIQGNSFLKIDSWYLTPIVKVDLVELKEFRMWSVYHYESYLGILRLFQVIRGFINAFDPGCQVNFDAIEGILYWNYHKDERGKIIITDSPNTRVLFV